MIKINGVICHNSLYNSRVFKDHITLCTCTKSRQPWTLP